MAALRKPQRSLQARALQWLAQREHSRSELRSKLLAVAQAQSRVDAAEEAEVGDHSACDAVHAEGDAGAGAASAAGQVDALLDWLEAHRYLCQERFVEARVHARAERFGNLRIRQELKQHQVTLPDDAVRALRDSEVKRARCVRERKFEAWPANATERAKQARFLAGRGFSPEAIRSALRDATAAADDADDTQRAAD